MRCTFMLMISENCLSISLVFMNDLFLENRLFSGELVMHAVFSWLRIRSYLCINNEVISQLFITLLDTEDSCSGEASILLPQLSRSGLYTVLKLQLLHNRAVCVCTTANGFSKARVGQRGGEGRGEDKGQDIRGGGGWKATRQSRCAGMGTWGLRGRTMTAGLPESICCDSLRTLSASSSPSQLKVMSRQANLAAITHLMFVQQQMDHTWRLLFVIGSRRWHENREGKERKWGKRSGRDRFRRLVQTGPHQTVTSTAVCSKVYLHFPWCWTVCMVTSRATSPGNSWIQHLISRSPSTLFPPYHPADQKTWIMLVKVVCSILEDTDKRPPLLIFGCEDSRTVQVILSRQRKKRVPTRSECDKNQAI